MSRMVYNDTATKMNRLVRMWPSSFVASMLNFREKEYLKVDEEKKSNYPNLDEAFGKEATLALDNNACRHHDGVGKPVFAQTRHPG